MKATSNTTIEQQNNASVIQAYKNARTTYYRASGHYKAAMNEAAMLEYLAELNRRGIEPPPITDEGEFNGPGSR